MDYDPSSNRLEKKMFGARSAVGERVARRGEAQPGNSRGNRLAVPGAA
jgi:hypothetical protein